MRKEVVVYVYDVVGKKTFQIQSKDVQEKEKMTDKITVRSDEEEEYNGKEENTPYPTK